MVLVSLENTLDFAHIIRTISMDGANTTVRMTGMGIKAVSTPILASETAVGFWRGSSILAWQLWYVHPIIPPPPPTPHLDPLLTYPVTRVAFGIMMGFIFNMIFSASARGRLTFRLIVGAPCVPALVLAVVCFFFCPESPRYYMRRGSPHYNPKKAYLILRKLRNTEVGYTLRTFSVKPMNR